MVLMVVTATWFCSGLDPSIHLMQEAAGAPFLKVLMGESQQDHGIQHATPEPICWIEYNNNIDNGKFEHLSHLILHTKS